MISNNNEFFTKEVLANLISATGIGFWVWDFETDTLNLSDEYFKVVGYEPGDILGHMEQWWDIVHPDDRHYVQENLKQYRAGKTLTYLSEFRIIKKNGTVIWVQDRGQFIQRSADGTPLQMAAIIQNVTLRKGMEQRLREKQRKLKLAMTCSGLAVWEWDLSKNTAIYSEEYAELLGYKKGELDNSAEQWSALVHPEDLPRIKTEIKQYLQGELEVYSQKLRVKTANGPYIWVKDMGEVVERDDDGVATKIIGGRLDIDELERAHIQLEHYQDDLEAEIQHRTEALTRQDTLLMEITKISQKLMATPKGQGFNEVVFQSMDELTSVNHRSRLAIFRNKTVDGKPFCYLANHRKNSANIYRKDFSQSEVEELFSAVDLARIFGEAFQIGEADGFYQGLTHKVNQVDFSQISYEEHLPTFYKYCQENAVLNVKTTDLHENEFIFMQTQGIRSILLSPIYIGKMPWGFIVMDDSEARTFTAEEEKMLSLAGSVFAQAIHQNETEMVAQEAIEQGKLMLDATPICCNLWLSDGTNVDCSNESVRLFELDSQQEYLDRYGDLSPEFQPCGRKSKEKFKEMVMIAREMSYHRFEWMHQKLNGDPIPCEITLVRIKYKDDFAVAGYTRDLREFKAMLAEIEANQQRLRLAHEEAVLSSKAKSNFLANMSHEIRTPMNAISGMTDIILRETEKTEVHEYAHNIKRACDSLLGIINDVLDISKIESGKLDIIEEEYDLGDLLNDVIQIANARLAPKSLMFLTSFQPELPKRLWGDATRMKQTILNILNNAIKFTDEGHVKLEVSGRQTEEEVALKITVSDTGSGISVDDMEKLFIEFERVNTTKNRSIEGTGLGLAISKRLCEMMGGTLSVRSELGKGSAFTIEIKQKFSEYQPLAFVGKHLSVLIFETRELYRQSMEEACKELGVSTVSCGLQSELNEALDQNHFDFVFTTWMYLAKVEEMLTTADFSAQIVLLADNPEIKAQYDHTSIVLPTNTLQIANVLTGTVPQNEEEPVLINFVAPSCHVLVVDDNQVNLKVAEGLMKPYEFEISTAENGAKAVEMIQNNHFDMVFMDHMMPVMDGIDATNAIRHMEGDYFKKLPIVALTANAIIGTREMFLKEGMNDFLAKPINLSTLHEIISRWLPKETQIILNQEEIPEKSAEPQISIPKVDCELGIQRVGGEFQTYLDIITTYYSDGIKRKKSISDLLDQEKFTEFKIEVHAIKSASASIGATALSEQARKLEEAANETDWDFIRTHSQDFLENFGELLENIQENIRDFLPDEEDSGQEQGDFDYLKSILLELEEALDCVNIKECDRFLADLYQFQWSDEQQNLLDQIKGLINCYEYDEAVEYIQIFLA